MPAAAVDADDIFCESVAIYLHKETSFAIDTSSVLIQMES